MYKRYYDIDVDAKAYANNIVKAGGRIPSDIGSVSDFIRKLKQNNLYHSIIECFFLRRNQNIGTGTIVYGLKQFIGTLINSPTWSESGIINSATGYILTNIRFNGEAQTNIFVGCNTSSAGLQAYYNDLSDINTRGTRQRADVVIYGDGSLQNLSYSTTNLGSFKVTGFSHNDKNIIGFLNNSTSTLSSAGSRVLIPSQPISILAAANAGDIQQHFIGTGSLFIRYNTALSAAEYITLYSIIKSTIAKGLNLP
jgi:hypothetical protein